MSIIVYPFVRQSFVILVYLLALAYNMIISFILFVKFYIIAMINSCKSTKRINAFCFVSIPSPRDVFARYGERLSSRGEYTSSGEQVLPALVSSSSVIDQMINAQSFLLASPKE